MNITDVDDKLIVRVQQEGATEGDMASRVKALAESVTADYLQCLQALGVDGIDHMPRATEHIGDIIEITTGLIEKGFAYASQGDVYFEKQEDGRWRSSQMFPDEEVTITGSAEGYASKSEKVKIPEAETKELKFTLEKAADKKAEKK